MGGVGSVVLWVGVRVVGRYEIKVVIVRMVGFSGLGSRGWVRVKGMVVVWGGEESEIGFWG